MNYLGAMTGLDCNILIQLALEDHPAHTATLAVTKAEAQQGNRLVFPALVVNEFLHVATDSRRFNPPLTMTEALDWREDLLSDQNVGLLDSNTAGTNLTLQWMRQFNLGRKRILDTQLAAIFHIAGVRRLLASNPGDFTVFGVFETITP